MNLEQSLYTELAATTELKDIVGSKIYPLITPEISSIPSVTYQKISDPAVHAMGCDPNIRHPRFQINSWSTSYSQAKAISAVIKNKLQDFSGKLGSSDGVLVQRIFYEHEIDMVHVEDNREKITYHLMQDYIIWYSS